MTELPNPHVGICWQGSKGYRGDRWRSVPLEHFEPLIANRSAAFISLHKGEGETELANSPLRPAIVDLSSEMDSGPDAFIDTAAIMHSLDLVITSDTAVAHLAGALGRPTWLLLPLTPDWRWLLDRDDSPWYPSMRLFRQSAPGDWRGAIGRLTAALADTHFESRRP